MKEKSMKNGKTARGISRAAGRFLAAVFAPAFAPAFAAEVNLYTDRQEVFLRAAAAAYEKESGDKVNTLFVNKGLLERALAEGDSSPADVFLLADIGRLLDFVDNGLTAPVDSPELNAAVPANLRAPDGHWFAVAGRGFFSPPPAPVLKLTKIWRTRNIKASACGAARIPITTRCSPTSPPATDAPPPNNGCSALKKIWRARPGEKTAPKLKPSPPENAKPPSPIPIIIFI